MTEFQKQFLLSFFKNEDYVGWKSIATKLIEDGSCVVAGKVSIWLGGIGNFIKVSDAENAVDCSLYEFDLEEFKTSKYFLEYWSIKKLELFESYAKIKKNYTEIVEIL